MPTLYGIVKAIANYDDGGAQSISFDTFNEAGIEPKVSEGEEKVLRQKNKILGVAETEDIMYGGKIKLVDNTFTPELLALIDGGTLVKLVDVVTGYTPPKSTDAVNRKEFELILVCEEKIGKKVNQYVKYTFPACKGKPIGISLKGEDFAVQEFNIEAAETDTEPWYKWDYIDQTVFDAL